MVLKLGPSCTQVGLCWVGVVLEADDGPPFPNPVREGLPTTHPELMLASHNPICETPE